jgi:CDGSH-type Zn-finger protein
MFKNNPNIEQIAEEIWIWRNFVSEEENNLITSKMKEFENQFEDAQEAFKYDGHAVDWYKNKTGPLMLELKSIWDRISEVLYPEHYIHPQLFVQVMRPGDKGMFIHADSPGMNMEHHLTQLDRWSTCCRLSHGIVTYFGDYAGGEIYYPNIEKDGTVKNKPEDPDDCLVVDVKPRDFVIHGALHPWEHGVREVTGGKRYAYSNFCMEKEHAPGTFELFDPNKHPYMKDEEEIMNWVKTVYPETTFCKKKCICGNSADLPYCDNTHKIINKRKMEEESTK